MKTKISPGCPVVWRLARQLLPVVFAWTVTAAGAAETKPASVTEPKTHALFMGADISVEYKKTMYRVKSAVDGAVVINVAGKDVRIAADWAKVKLKVDRSLKLTGTSASVNNLKGERAYTPGNDPLRNFQKELLKAEQMHGENALAQHAAVDAKIRTEFQPVTGSDPTGMAAAQHAQAVRDAIGRQNATENAGIGQNRNTVGSAMEVEGQESFDAMKVTFEVSAETALSDPYVVILGQYHEKKDKPGTVANWCYVQSISSITNETRKVEILAGGLPPGFEMDYFQVHLYNRGNEIATDVAPKRVALTREEAFTYALIEYLGNNKGKSATAKPFMGKLSKEARSQLSTGQLAQPYYVKVTKEGRPIAAFLDTQCSLPVDAVVAALIEHARFYPALDKGKAIEGVAELKFSQLLL